MHGARNLLFARDLKSFGAKRKPPQRLVRAVRWLSERGENVFAACVRVCVRARARYFSRVYVITIDSNTFLSLMLGVHQRMTNSSLLLISY